MPKPATLLKNTALWAMLGLLTLPPATVLALSWAEQWRYPDILPQWSAERWVSLFSGASQTGAAVFSSFLLSATVSAVATLLGMATAYYLGRRPRLRLLALAPYVFSPVIYAHSLLYFFHRTALAGTWGGVGVGQIVLFYPFAFLVFSTRFDDRLMAMNDLVLTLGGSRWTAFRRVLLPALKPVAGLCLFQLFVFSWFEFGLSLVVGLGQVKTLAVSLHQYLGEAHVPLAALSASLLMLPPVLYVMISKNTWLRPETAV